jgi:hypothetical protein
LEASWVGDQVYAGNVFNRINVTTRQQAWSWG